MIPWLAAWDILAESLRHIPWLAGYVGGEGSFPLPLDEQEESRLVQAMLHGDTEARNILIEHNLRLVAHVVKKFESTGEETEDLISIGTIGLIKAINTFDPGRRTRLATYAAKCIENEILMHLRSVRKNRGETLLYDPIGSDGDGNDVTLIDVLGSDADSVSEAVEAQAEKDRLRRTLTTLTKRERWVLQMRYGLLDGMRKTQRDVSRQLGISRSYVSRIEKRALTKLQQQLQNG
ncbi:RNA polymerase sporulation sigma factor SigK [Carboxydochorda subterranea]|uniref:RNA polymerase sigma factor n=1 Tax=Carboxydichorda subterranea TaxID=3109565 RepID=A0ABZ1C299_9FIRM|nr:RNA polymerase sporulation sigma factor SigK [Limnochorda sp. L945t]WRP18313.1 RNA polymerase sporulation sigma factor SigK [Limnochorda sp. L945t]